MANVQLKSVRLKPLAIFVQVLFLALIAAAPSIAAAATSGGMGADMSVKVPQTDARVSQVSLGNSHSVALLEDGSLWAWGNNGEGQLGDGTTNGSPKPIQIFGGGVSAVEAGSFHTAAIMDDGSLWVWGDNAFGQLGDGSTQDRILPFKLFDSGVRCVSLSYRNGAAVMEDGSLWTWGDNFNGQIGDGTKEARLEPVKVMDSGVKGVSIDYTHGAAVMEDGSLWTWGSNSSGEIGDGTTEERLSPVKVIDSGVKSVSCSSNGATGALMTDGSLWTWGQDGNGQLGNGQGKRPNIETSKPSMIVPSGVEQFMYGGGIGVLVRSDGSLWTWGCNLYGEIGDGTTEDKESPTMVIDSGVSSASVGEFHSAAVKADGSLWAWGRNWSGELGDGTYADRYRPTMIEGFDEQPTQDFDEGLVLKAIAANELTSETHLLKGLHDFVSGQRLERVAVEELADYIRFFEEPLWQGAEAKVSDLAVQELGGYDLETGALSPNYAIYTSPNSSQCIISFGDFRDFDLKGSSDHLIEAAEICAKGIEEFGRDNVVITGAGYGGVLASYACMILDSPGLIFNSAGYGVDMAFVNNPSDLVGFSGVQDIPVVHYYTQRYYDEHVSEDSSDEFTFYPSVLVSDNGRTDETYSLSSMYSLNAEGEFILGSLSPRTSGAQNRHRAGKPSNLFDLASEMLLSGGVVDHVINLLQNRDLISVGTDAADDFGASGVASLIDSFKAQIVYPGDSGSGTDVVKTGSWGDSIVAGAGSYKFDGGLGNDIYIIGPESTDVRIDDFAYFGAGTVAKASKVISIGKSMFEAIGEHDLIYGFISNAKDFAEFFDEQGNGDYVLIPADLDSVDVSESGDYFVVRYGDSVVRINRNRLMNEVVTLVGIDGGTRQLDPKRAEKSQGRAAGSSSLAGVLSVRGPELASVTSNSTGELLFELPAGETAELYKPYGYFVVDEDGGFDFEFDATEVSVSFSGGNAENVSCSSVGEGQPSTMRTYSLDWTDCELGGQKRLEVSADTGALEFSICQDDVSTPVPVSTTEVSTDVSPDSVLLSSEDINMVPSQEWSGGPIRPEIVVEVAGKLLESGVDYEIGYLSNDRPGVASVVITGRGAYSGTISKSFEIVDNEAPFYEEDGQSKPGSDSGVNPGPAGPSGPATPSRPTYSPVIEQPEIGGKVEVSNRRPHEGDEVVITAVPDSGYEVVDITVIDANGEGVEVGQVSDCVWSFVQPSGQVTIKAIFEKSWRNPFSDVSENDWFYDSVKRVNRLKLMNGYDGTDRFGPNDFLTREQAATVMYNMLADGATAIAAPHVDVDPLQWYAPYVNWAVAQGVMDGYSSTEFGIGDALTREQFACVIAKAANAEVGAADLSLFESYRDGDEVSDWAVDTLAWAIEQGVIHGVDRGNGTFDLEATREITRAEMAAMMLNAIDSGVFDKA